MALVAAASDIDHESYAGGLHWRQKMAMDYFCCIFGSSIQSIHDCCILIVREMCKWLFEILKTK